MSLPVLLQYLTLVSNLRGVKQDDTGLKPDNSNRIRNIKFSHYNCLILGLRLLVYSLDL